MRADRPNWLALGALAIAIAPASAAAQDATQVLNYYRPSVAGVEFDTPATDAEKAACKLEYVKGASGSDVGYAIRDPQGRLLRRIIDTDPSKLNKRGGEDKPRTHVDRWSYYRDGFEIYRESDTNEDGVLDEVRWLNAGGSRVGEIRIVPDKSGKKSIPKVVAWKRISAEEASKVLVQALAADEMDMDLLATVMARPQDAEALGLPPEAVTRTAVDLQGPAAALWKQLAAKGWGHDTTWSRFDGTMPRVIPADASSELTNDVTLYENAVIMANPADPQSDPLAMAYLHVPELLQVGETWKFLELPKAVDPRLGRDRHRPGRAPFPDLRQRHRGDARGREPQRRRTLPRDRRRARRPPGDLPRPRRRRGHRPVAPQTDRRAPQGPRSGRQ